MRISRITLLFLFFLIISSGYILCKNYTFNSSDRDPFSPLVSKTGLILIPQDIDFVNLKLDGIIYSKGESLAIINGEVLKKGGKIGEYNILSISEKEVVLDKEGKQFTLKLEE